MEMSKYLASAILLFSVLAHADSNDEYSYPSPEEKASGAVTKASTSTQKLIEDKSNLIDFSLINTKAVWTHDFKFQYPSMSGMTKNQAATTRKTLLKDAVLSVIKAIKEIPTHHKGIQQDLDKNIQLPLSRSQAEEVIAAIEKLNILEQEEADGEYNVETNLPLHLREITTKVYALIPDDNRHSKTKDEIIDDLVGNKNKRIDFIGALILSATQLNPKRDNDKITLSVRIDLPQIYKKFPLKAVDQFLEK